MGRGSTWRIWDFHLHTPCSVLNRQFGDPHSDETWERYIEAIETTAAKKGIAAIGITDYFTIEGYKRVLEYREQGRLKDVMVFPNIEFRVDPIIDGRRLNYHVLFSPEVPVTDIEEHFLHDLNFVHNQETFERKNLRKLKVSNLEDFGETLRAQHKPFQKKTPLEIGFMNAKVALDEIKQRLIDDHRFSGEYLLVLADDFSIDWNSQDHAVRKQLIQMSHAIFTSNGKSREFYLGKRHASEDAFVDEFRSLKPCIWGCDAHGFEQRFLEPDQERYCWVKGEVSWEGLKQVLYEPEERVRIQRDSPEPSKSYFTLDSVRVEATTLSDRLCIDEVEIDLNPNLVTIIGGRGSGKTALLDLIAACFSEGRKLSEIENSFYYRLYEAPKRRPVDPPSVPVTLRFRSGDEFPKQVGRDETFFEHSDVLYLTQNHMDEYTANPAILYKHIVDLVFEQNPDQRKAYDALHERARNLQREIESINLNISQLREEVNSKLGEEQERRTQKKGELADYRSRLEEQGAQQAESATTTLELTERLKELKTTRDRMIALRERLETIRRNFQAFHEQYKRDAKAVNERITALPEAITLSKLPHELSELPKVTAVVRENIAALSAAQPTTETRIEAVQEDLSALQGIDATIAQLRQTIDSLTSEIDAIDERISELRDKEQRIKSLDDLRVAKFTQMMQTIREQRLYLQKIIDQFEVGQDELLAGLSFAAVVDTSNANLYVERLAEKVDGRSHSLDSIASSLSEIIEDAKEVLNSPSSGEDNDTNVTDELLPLIKRLRERAGELKLRQLTTESDFFNAVFTPFCEIGLHIEFNERPLEALSMGERAIVLLKILLGLDDKPLIIDQPEEHLDNRYIYDELMPAFRKAKAKRQIIVATHNANLVVNTDAEQIIVAEHENGTLSYRVGALEDLNIRESITRILEGGDQAFRKREEKYGLLFGLRRS